MVQTTAVRVQNGDTRCKATSVRCDLYWQIYMYNLPPSGTASDGQWSPVNVHCLLTQSLTPRNSIKQMKAMVCETQLTLVCFLLFLVLLAPSTFCPGVKDCYFRLLPKKVYQAHEGFFKKVRKDQQDT